MNLNIKTHICMIKIKNYNRRYLCGDIFSVFEVCESFLSYNFDIFEVQPPQRCYKRPIFIRD